MFGGREWFFSPLHPTAPGGKQNRHLRQVLFPWGLIPAGDLSIPEYRELEGTQKGSSSPAAELWIRPAGWGMCSVPADPAPGRCWLQGEPFLQSSCSPREAPGAPRRCHHPSAVPWRGDSAALVTSGPWGWQGWSCSPGSTSWGLSWQSWILQRCHCPLHWGSAGKNRGQSSQVVLKLEQSGERGWAAMDLPSNDDFSNFPPSL